MISLALATLLLAPQDNWHAVRFGETGLKIQLPDKEIVTKTAEETQLTCTYKSVQISFVAAQKSPDQIQPLSAAYAEKYKNFQEKYGRKIKGILNESPVIEAYQFGAPESIGFVLEVDEGGGKVNAWQRVYMDGWEYDLNITCDRRDQAVMEKVLGSAQYVDPVTGDFRTAPLGGTGLQSYLGVAFLPRENVDRAEATSVVLDSEQFPAMLLATVWQNEEVDYENQDQLKKAMGKWLAAFVQGAESNLKFEATKTEGQTLFDVSGTVVVQGIEINLMGKVFAHRDDAQVVIAVVDPRQDGAIDFASKVLKTVSQIPKAD